MSTPNPPTRSAMSGAPKAEMAVSHTGLQAAGFIRVTRQVGKSHYGRRCSCERRRGSSRRLCLVALSPRAAGAASASARALPSPVRVRIRSRSNSASPPRPARIRLPCAVVVSAHASPNDGNPDWLEVIATRVFNRSRVDQASRSSLVTISTSQASRAAMASRSCTRSVLAPDATSRRTRSAGGLQGATCAVTLCPSVETRAYP